MAEAQAQAAENKYLECQGIPSTQPYPNPYVPPSPEPSPSSEPQTAPPPSPPPAGPKKLCDAYILGVSLGLFGAHHFYLRRYGFGFLYLFTFGLLGCGYLADLFRMPVLVREANKRIREPTEHEDKKIHEAYVLWFPMGLFGFHNFYLGRILWGMLYFCTFGLVGIGWLIDGIRLARLVAQANKKEQDVREGKPPLFRNVCDVCVLTLNPVTGLLGVQHYYLHRPGFGFFYTLTLGGLGVGWLVDCFRMPHLVRDINSRKTHGHDGSVRLDDVYTLAFPLGFLGLHHFYLRRPCWGFVYLFTFGCLGIGWLVDLFRLPCLVRDYNQRFRARQVVEVTAVAGMAVNGAAVNGGFEGGLYPSAYPTAYPSGPTSPPGQYPPQQQPQGYPYPPPPYQHGVDYGAAGETSWSTINSSDFGAPPSYEVSQDQINPSLQNEMNQQKSAPPAERY